MMEIACSIFMFRTRPDTTSVPATPFVTSGIGLGVWHICLALGAEFKEPHMAKSDHNKAAELHENAAKSHRAAADQHGKGDHAKGMEHLRSAQQQHSQSETEQYCSLNTLP